MLEDKQFINHQIFKTLRSLVILAIYLPYFNLILFFIIVLIGRNKLGHFPKVNDPSPFDLGLGEIYRVITFLEDNIILISIVIITIYVLIRCEIGNILKISRIHFFMFFMAFVFRFYSMMIESYWWLYD